MIFKGTVKSTFKSSALHDAQKRFASQEINPIVYRLNYLSKGVPFHRNTQRSWQTTLYVPSKYPTYHENRTDSSHPLNPAMPKYLQQESPFSQSYAPMLIQDLRMKKYLEGYLSSKNILISTPFIYRALSGNLVRLFVYNPSGMPVEWEELENILGKVFGEYQGPGTSGLQDGQVKVKIDAIPVVNPVQNADIMAQYVLHMLNSGLKSTAIYDRIVNSLEDGDVPARSTADGVSWLKIAGFRLRVKGRPGGEEMAIKHDFLHGSCPKERKSALIDFGKSFMIMRSGSVGAKCWVHFQRPSIEDEYSSCEFPSLLKLDKNYDPKDKPKYEYKRGLWNASDVHNYELKPLVEKMLDLQKPSDKESSRYSSMATRFGFSTWVLSLLWLLLAHVASGTGHQKSLLIQKYAIDVFALAANNDYLYSVANNDIIERVILTGEIIRTLRGHTGFVRTLNLKDDKLYSSADDGNVVIWDLNSGAILARIRNPAPAQCLVSLFHENSIFYGCTDNSIRRLDLDTNSFTTSFFGHKKPVTGLAIAKGFLFSASIDDREHSVRKFDIVTAQENPNSIYYLSNTNVVTTFNDFLVCGCDDGSIVVWNIVTGQRHDLVTGIVSKPISSLVYYNGFLYATSEALLARFKWVDNKFVFDRFLDATNNEIKSTTTFGPRIFTGDSGTSIYRYNMNSGWFLSSYYSQTKKIRSMVLGKDGFIFSGGDDCLIRKWNPLTYELDKILKGHTGVVAWLLYDTLSKTLYSSGADSRILQWNTDTGEILSTITITGGLANVIKMYEGVLYAATSTRVVSCWSLQTGELLRTLSMSGEVTALDVSDQYIVAGDANRQIQIFNRETGVKLQEYTMGGYDRLLNIIIRDGHFLVSLDGSIWSNHFSEQFTLVFRGSDQIGSMAVVEGYALIFGLLGGAIRFLDVNNNYQPMYTLEGHSNIVTSLRIEGSFLFSSSMDGSVRKWDLNSFSVINVMDDSNDASKSLVAYSDTVLVAAADGSVNAFNSTTAKIKGKFLGPETKISFLSYHNRTVYTFTLNGKIQRRDAENFSIFNEVSLQASQFSSFHVGDSGIFAATSSKTIIWLTNASVPVVTLHGFNSTVTSMTSLGNYLFTGGESNSILVWDLRQRKIIKVLTGHDGMVTCLLKIDGSLFSGSEDNTIIRWDDGFNIVRIYRRTFTIPGHIGPIRAIAITANVLFSASDDKMIKQWQIDTGRIMDTIEGHTAKINDLVFYNSTLYSASNDGAVLVWNPVIPHQFPKSTASAITPSSMRRETIIPRDWDLPASQNSRLSDLAIVITAVAGCLILITFVCVWRYSRYIIDRDSSKNTSASNNRKTSAIMDPEGTLFATHLGAAKPAYLEVDPTGFRLRKKVGKGGAGSIYLAEILPGSNIEFAEDNDIIVKVIYADYNKSSPSQQQTFDQEITIMTMLQEFRNIARIVGYCHVPCCILMKYYLYGSLDTWIYKKRLLSYSHKMVAHFMLDIGRGLMCMHARWLIHCDIKPQNVLIDRDEANGIYFCVLTDFGITNIVSDKVLAAKTFNVANLRGMSCRYAAPECFKRFRERKNDSPKVMAAGDIFAFSILLLECLTRKMPWKESKTDSETGSGYSSEKKSESSQA